MNEVLSLVSKAARGAGAPPAQAIAFGRAAVCHLTAGRTERALRDALAALPQGPILSLPLDLARLIEVSDNGVARGVMPASDHPELVKSYVESLPFRHSVTPVDGGLQVEVTVTEPAGRAPLARLELSDGFVQMLTELLERILVPDTAASRLGGAGAGLTDND